MCWVAGHENGTTAFPSELKLPSDVPSTRSDTPVVLSVDQVSVTFTFPPPSGHATGDGLAASDWI